MRTSSERTNSSCLALSRPAQGVLRLTMCRPERRNTLSLSAMRELLGALETAEADPTVRCVLIEAQGPVFSAGHDLKELARLQKSERRSSEPVPSVDPALAGGSDKSGLNSRATDNSAEVFAVCGQLMIYLVRSGTPSIAVVRGLATAAGCQLVASCDLAVASEHASFATPGVDIGLFCSTPSVALSRNIPRKAAMEMLLLGERISAQRALTIGLVNRVIPDDELEEEAVDMARTIASKPRGTIAEGKANFYRQIENGLEAAYIDMGRAMVEGLLGQDAEEGIAAFIKKRKPHWNDS